MAARVKAEKAEKGAAAAPLSIGDEIAKAFGIKFGAKDSREKQLAKLHEGATEGDETAWDNLSPEAQEWVNSATRAKNDEKPLPDFDKAADPEPEAKPAKGKAKAEEKPAKAPAKGKSAKEAEPEAKPAKGKAKAEEKPAKASAKASDKKRGGGEEGYKGHRSGSRKEKVHKAFDEHGAEKAMKEAVKLGIKEGSAKSWIGSWGGRKRAAKPDKD